MNFEEEQTELVIHKLKNTWGVESIKDNPMYERSRRSSIKDSVSGSRMRLLVTANCWLEGSTLQLSKGLFIVCIAVSTMLRTCSVPTKSMSF